MIISRSQEAADLIREKREILGRNHPDVLARLGALRASLESSMSPDEISDRFDVKLQTLLREKILLSRTGVIEMQRRDVFIPIRQSSLYNFLEPKNHMNLLGRNPVAIGRSFLFTYGEAIRMIEEVARAPIEIQLPDTGNGWPDF